MELREFWLVKNTWNKKLEWSWEMKKGNKVKVKKIIKKYSVKELLKIKFIKDYDNR